MLTLSSKVDECKPLSIGWRTPWWPQSCAAAKAAAAAAGAKAAAATVAVEAEAEVAAEGSGCSGATQRRSRCSRLGLAQVPSQLESVLSLKPK